MKKLTFTALVLMIGTVAFASTLGIPWYVDNGAPNGASPPIGKAAAGSYGQCTMIFLKNNTGDALPCTIMYYSAEGAELGPFGTTSINKDNTFSIPANAAVAFRPVQDDPAAEPAGRAIPNRPAGGANGSIVISWEGTTATDVQGYAVSYQNWYNTAGTATTRSLGWAYLLPTGVSGS